MLKFIKFLKTLLYTQLGLFGTNYHKSIFAYSTPRRKFNFQHI